jgi:hypothetical protein
MTTVGTQLGRWKPAANKNEVSIPPSSFVFDLPERLTVRGLADRPGKLGFRHAFEVQRFARNRAVVFDDRNGKLMSEVGATVGDLLVFTSQLAARFGPIRAPLLLAGNFPLGAFDLAFGFSEESRVFDNAAIGIGGKTIKARINANRRFSFNRGLWQIGKIKLGDQRDIPFAGCLALEFRALERQVNRLRLSNLGPSDFRNIDAAIFEFDPLRDAERLLSVVFLLEFRETRPLLKEVVKRLLAIGDGLLRQLRINFFQPLETRLDLKSGQFSRKRRPGDGFAGLLIGLFSTLERPVKDEPSRAGITSKRRLLLGGRVNPKPVDLSFRHSISSALRVDIFGDCLLRNRACGRSEITRRPHARHPAKTLEFFSQNTRCIALQSKHNLADSEMLRAIEKQMDVIRFNSQMHNRDVDLRRFLPQQCDQPLSYIADKRFATTARYPDGVIPDRSHRALVVSIPVKHKHLVLSGRRRVNGATRCSAPCQIHPLTGSEGLSLVYL